MNLLSYAARKFEVPVTHTIHRKRLLGDRHDTYGLKSISFTDNQLIATYGDEDGYELQFDVVIRGQS